jgi:hypothetical protein
MSTIETRGDGERVDVVFSPGPVVVGERHEDGIAFVERQNQLSARLTRWFQRIPDPPPPPTEGYIHTAGFASRCGVRTFRTHPLALHTEAVAFVRVADCPATVLDILRAAGLADFLAAAAGEDVIDLGDAVQLSTIIGQQQVGPRPFIRVEEIVRRNLGSVTAQEVRAEADKAALMAQAEARRKNEEEVRKMNLRHAHEAAAAEAERRQAPAYAIRKMAEEMEAEKKRLQQELEAEKQKMQSELDARVAAAVQAALDRATAPPAPAPPEGQP